MPTIDDVAVRDVVFQGETVVDKTVRIFSGSNLLGILSQLESQLGDINAWLTSQEVYRAGQGGAAVEGVSTANMATYRLDNDELVFDLLSRPGNPFIDSRFRKDAYDGISKSKNEFFFLSDAMKQHVMSAITDKKSVTVRYSGLNVKTENCGPTFGYIESGSSNTDEEKKLFKAVYGIDNPGNGKKVYLLMENVVKTELAKRPEDMIARACSFNDPDRFIAMDRRINYDPGNLPTADRRSDGQACSVIGLLSANAAEGYAQKATDGIARVRMAYSILNAANNYAVVEALHPDDATGMLAAVSKMSSILAQYNANSQKK